MKIKLDSLKADLERENAGDWVDIPELPGVRLKVKSFNSPEYRVSRDLAIQRLFKKYGRVSPAAGVVAEEYGKLYADHILLGWEGFDVPFSKEKALELLSDPAFRALQQHVEYAAGKLGEIELEFVEDAVKN